MQAKLRRYKDTLIVTGSGVIVFGVWSMIRVFLEFVLQTSDMDAFLEIVKALEIPLAVIYLVVALMLMIPLGFHLYVGMCARAEGYEKKKKSGSTRRYAYLVFAFLMAIVFGAGLFFKTAQLFSGASDAESNGIIALVIDATFLFVLLRMIIASIQVKRLGKKTAGEVA